MEIMVTLPADPEEREALLLRAARLHAEGICAALAGLRCPAGQKSALLTALKCPNRPEKEGRNRDERTIHEHNLTKL